MRGREVDRWREGVIGQPLPQMVRALVDTGFRGLVVDRAGYADHAAELEPELTRLLGVEPVVSRGRDCRYSFYDLTPYASRCRSGGPTAGGKRKGDILLSLSEKK